MRDLYDKHIPEEIPEDAILIIGAGHFGGRAARLLSNESKAPLFIVDLDKKSLSQLEDLPVKRIVYDGTLFLVKYYHLLNPSNIIVPAIPLHLAYVWVKRYLESSRLINMIDVPDEIKPLLPFTWQGSEGSLLVSYADFECPDDCPEPEYCTVTGERRDNPLHDLLGHVRLPGFKTHVIRSHQLAPGLGGYKLRALTGLAERLSESERGKWLLGTSCRCHGIVTAIEIYQTQTV
ncbi:MAG: hypothetical protein JRJ86_09830 [Deltaproteobacteria bacterium]|nr:hypothetical protein [Deltaproteobacteria bacterium]MBW2117585.1 hypothetical protein [Deltaproteobacteria bacterium]MBW2344103.1 hypothetical protein [Deltaproteobacteria bacterium]